MDELVIINPAYSGSVWWSGGTVKGRTEHRKPEPDGPTETKPDNQSVKCECRNTAKFVSGKK